MNTKTPDLVRRISDPKTLEARRRLAVQRVLEGESQIAVAASLKVSAKSVNNWVAAFRLHGEDGLKARKPPGPASKLTPEQEREVCSWLLRDATDFGFRTNLWTSPRVVKLIHETFGIRYNANYFCEWLNKRDFTPQKPRKVAEQRNEARIINWYEELWPAILKKGLPKTPI